jgi:ACR3 family arsenite efflux pump ArsB
MCAYWSGCQLQRTVRVQCSIGDWHISDMLAASSKAARATHCTPQPAAYHTTNRSVVVATASTTHAAATAAAAAAAAVAGTGWQVPMLVVMTCFMTTCRALLTASAGQRMVKHTGSLSTAG